MAEPGALEKDAMQKESRAAADSQAQLPDSLPIVKEPGKQDEAALERDPEKQEEKDVVRCEPEKELANQNAPNDGYLSPQSTTDALRKESVETQRPSLALSESEINDAGSPHPEATRPTASRGSTIAPSSKSVRTLEPLTRKETKLAQKQAQPLQHLGITLGGPMIILFDIVIPCIIYYTWFDKHRAQWERQCHEQYGVLGGNAACPIPKPEFDKDILGSAIACFGFGELWILVARVYRLVVRPEECAPLLSRNRWELDATSWVYGVAMILALIPFVIGSSLELPHLYLYSPIFIMGFLGLLMTVTTLLPFKIPIGINSHARGTGLRPFIYYAAEDFIAVDGLQDREFRIRYNERYESNRMFRRFFYNLTLWWMLGVCVYIGAVSAVIWTCEFHIAFGLSFGVLFSYIACWAGVTFVWVKYEMKREHRAYEAGEVEA